jgi:hypothetical protein
VVAIKVVAIFVVSAFAMGVLAADTDEKVFLSSVDGALVLDISNNELRIRKAEWTENGTTYAIDGLTYPLDWNVVREKHRKLDVRPRLAIKADWLYFDRKPVELPRGMKMRNVWDAILWNRWVLCLGRTSNTDRQASDKPPFFASELVAFDAADRRAVVRYLSFNPPLDTAIQVLEATFKK